MDYKAFNGILDTVIPQLKEGAFLLSGKEKNAMTIGWLQFGIIWGKPICTVFVRKSRYSHELMENQNEFEICVPVSGEMKAELSFCGSKSGRDTDKTNVVNSNSKVYVKIACKTVAKTEMDMNNVDESILERYYNTNQATNDGDPHTIYFGEVTAVTVK